ncbi:MAG TPA: hypothetical protein PK323_01995 [Bacteroidia bacterium]|nr:hypothetical protein [Bacteroidia bacterium]
MKKWIKTKYKQIVISIFTILILYFGLRIYLNLLLKEVIIEQVEKFAENNYRLEIGKIDIGIWAFNANIENLKISKLKSKQNVTDKYHFNLSATHVKLKNLYLFDLLISNNLQLNRLQITNPIIVLEYNDTISNKTSNDTSFIHFYYKLSNIILYNPDISVIKSSGEKFKLYVNKIDYNLKNLLLQIEAIDIKGINCTQYNFDYNCYISKASIKGFDLNVLLNDMNFKYSSCVVEDLNIELKAHSILQHKIKPKISFLQNLKSKSSAPLSALSIEKIKFAYQSRFDNIVVNANNFKYENKHLEMEEIFLALRQKHYIESNISKLSIEGFDADEFIELKHSKIKKLFFRNPRFKISLIAQSNYSNSKIDTEDKIGYTIDLIEGLEIINGAIDLDHRKKRNLKLSVRSLDILAKNIDPMFFDDKQNVTLLRDVTLKTGNIHFNFPNNLYHLNLGKIEYSLLHKSLNIDSLKLKSNYNKSEFYKIVKKQIARIELATKSIYLKDFDINKILNENKFYADEIEAKKSVLTFYKDKNIPLNENDYKQFPQELLKDLNYPIYINRLQINECELVSEILNPGARNIAKININEIQAEFKHIDNTIYKGNTLKVIFEGKIAGAGLLKANAMIDMYATNYHHKVHAEIGSMPFKHLNDFMFDFAAVEISSGTLDRAIIDIDGNNNKIHCKLDLSYHNLNMDILRNRNKKNKKYRNIASILANTIIYNNNPEPGKKLRSSSVTQPYISNKFIVGNWINASLKAMLLTTSPSAANALQIVDSSVTNDSTKIERSPNWLKRFLQRKRKK